VLYNLSDAVDHCRRITRMADVSLMVDGEDGFGNAVNVVRTVKELEAAGVSAAVNRTEEFLHWQQRYLRA
jgi:2-methylisocitrate lyase-like PEP mutase family enzyme